MKYTQNKKTYIFILFIIVLSFTTYANDNIQIFMNDTPLYMDVEPVIINGRTMVPFRAIFESINAEIGWDEITRTAIGTKDNTRIELPIGQSYGVVNGITTNLDVPATIINGRTMVPLRFVTENMGFEVLWNGETRTIYLSDNGTPVVINDPSVLDKEFTFYDLGIGSSESDLKSKLGDPQRIDTSIYNFSWYVYNSDYLNYIQLGVKNGVVVAIYTNNANWVSKSGITLGTPKNTIISRYGTEIKSIIKGNVEVGYSNSDPNDEYGLYLIEDSYTRFFYDFINSKTVTSIFIVDKATELELQTFYGTPSEALRKSMERQIFDLANSTRVRFGLKVLEWNDLVAGTARKHSIDMAANNYFAHKNSDGEMASDRGENDGITYLRYAENIAAGQPNGIYAHEAWMNSLGHRENLLGDVDRLGVGVALGGSYDIYYTQNFYTPD